jgi:hypothetical protein
MPRMAVRLRLYHEQGLQTWPLVRGGLFRAPHGAAAYETTCCARGENFKDDAMIALPPPIERFLGELADDPWLGDIADQFRIALEALEGECADNHHAAQMMSCFGLIAEQNRPLRDRVTDIFEILSMPKGRITVTIRRSAA